MQVRIQVRAEVAVRLSLELLGFDPTYQDRRAPGTSRPFATDRELLEPEPGAWVLVPSTTGYAAPLAGNDGYPRCGGRTRLVTTPEIARVPFSRVQSACTCWYCLPLCLVLDSGYLVSSLFISRSTRLRLFSSLSPTSSVSLRPLHLLLPPLAASFASFFSLFPSSYFPLLHRGGAEAFYLCLVAHILPRPSKRLFYTPKNLHPSTHPRPSSWPRLASPALTAHRPPSCRCYWTSNWAAQPLTEPGLVPSSACGSPSTHRPPCRLPACVLRVDHRQSASCS